ncbi:MAG: response regulator [Nitrospiraceae bacterium]|nr:response regulator [Nitrospiraceae bacterium]
MDRRKEVDILLVEDDPGDVELTREGLKEGKMLVNLHTVDDGIKALRYLRRQAPYTDAVRPDIILLDLNLPRMDGRETLKEIKSDEALRCIPVVVLTTSEAETDVVKCYDLGANCYIAKPVGFDAFKTVVQSFEDFWFTLVKIPGKERL